MSLDRGGNVEYKVVMVGESGVGKTSLVEKFVSGKFSKDVSTTIGAAYVKCNVQIEEASMTLSLWDTAGQERFQSLIPLYLRNAHGLVFVFDAENDKDTKSLDTIYESLKDQILPDMQFVLCANKFDLVPPESDLSEFEAWGRKHKMELIKTSAKTGQNVTEIYSKLATLIYRNCRTQRKDRANTVFKDICQDDQPKKKGCC